MNAFTIRIAGSDDRPAIRDLVRGAFRQAGEADLVDSLATDGCAAIELVADADGRIVGHVLFSRLHVEADGGRQAAVALAPVAVDARHRRCGIAAALIEEAHRRLRATGEKLSVVLGDPAYYGRFGYTHDRAAGFDSDYQCEFLQALAWGDAPTSGRLIYADAFGGL